ncbi:MAG TPA: prephenate dehydrogenase [Candidatus Eisenbergiella merdipullorum]|uniref:Prephenate dehydrogenase n=1 Tax=Candidatus Eisenbergiella merdipullorum TaxID=2838553 RepID=A0A9D2L0U8_9FIRM|nr:prephenate dehydrogenase [Candidatus Eisenbergiella merdipullorum]
MKPLTCSFYGLGLIGGSIARALREARPDARILACDIQESALLQAEAEGIADETFSELDDFGAPSFCAADYVFLCAPVSHNNANLRFLKKYLQPESILTDVGSVKTPIHELAEREGLSSRFIGGHPMAGSERIGFANSRASLLENAYYILTPSAEVAKEKIQDLSELIRSIGAIPLILDYRQHDQITAAVSHLPHVVASSLVNLVRDSDSPDGLMKMIAAGGFKDITRIASSSTVMWQQICLANSVNISDLLAQYIDSLQQVKKEIDNHDAERLYAFFDGARRYRDSFIDASSGPIKKVYTINVEIPDEAGSLASVATLLALNGISIKNIGIVHNREAEEGVLRIEFYEPDAIEKAASLLAARGYVIFLKK